LNFCVLEARDRPGGRVHSKQESGFAVDLGAQWIGPGQKRMYALAEEFGLKTAPTHHKGKSVLQTENAVKTFRGAIPPLGLAGTLDAIQLSLRVTWLSRKSAIASPKLAAMRAADWINQKSYTKSGRDFWNFILTAGTCIGAEAFSTAELFAQIRSLGGLSKLETAEIDYFPGGAQNVGLKLAEGLSSKIKYEMPVSAITVEEDGGPVTIAVLHEKIQCRRVIVALPPQLYPKISLPSVDFKPAEVVTGIVTKNILVFEKPWWRESGFSGLSYSVKSPVGVTFDTSPDDSGPGVLIALAGGPQAKAFGELTEAERRKECEYHITNLFGDGPKATGFFTKNWTREPWSLGGYASRQKFSGRDLALNSGPVYFAGTEVSTEWRSYMEGALAAGEQAVTALRAGL
jgi:monoamine oxidase